MELCDFNLYTYIQGTLPSQMLSKVPHLFLDDHSTPQREISQACQIMTDIMKGVAYIHSLDEVHRDLKPQNGTIITNLADSKSYIRVIMVYGRSRILDLQRVERP
jgi:serine/threonine protein kinase